MTYESEAALNFKLFINKADTWTYEESDWILDDKGESQFDEDGFPIVKPGAIPYQIFGWNIAYRFNFDGHQYGQWLKTRTEREPYELTHSEILGCIEILIAAALDTLGQLKEKK